ncbi:hypothetical protein GOP47_0008747 [Adiantum capillus-veneris]|uniref:GDSL esterase/lipase n=1 Tax=Adiantum capillus-veneris TaxID=13818 RepID=A0A9D4UZQ2_ADICA|nr:hypothetical protein GOP47_0008747 [Adiantum capillus-veneris]
MASTFQPSIGGNYYVSALNSVSQAYSPATVIANLVPAVMSKIRNATEVLYANGGRRFLYISITPLGCSPNILSGNPNAPRDSNGCIPDFNSISSAHSAQLSSLVSDLPSIHADATFVFLDYNAAYLQVLANSASLGFTDTLNACCGAPNVPNRYSIATFCDALSTTTNSTLCPDPNVFLSWDGIHYTHKFQLCNFKSYLRFWQFS